MNHNVIDVLSEIANQYPSGERDEQVRDIPRIAFHIGMALDAVKPKLHADLAICDLGGGLGLFSVGCAAYGVKRSVLIDDFDDAWHCRARDSILDLHRSVGVEVIARDVVSTGLNSTLSDSLSA